MELLDLIETKKEELIKVLEKRNELESEIRELEERLVKREPDKLKNPDACLNPVMYFEESCHLCNKQLICSYRSKGEYSKLKNLHTTSHRKAQEVSKDVSEGDSTP